MSAQHTQGRLTVNPIRLDQICTEDGSACIAVANRDGAHPLTVMANARRLVACWNACEGLPTVLLERHTTDGGPAFPSPAVYDHTREQVNPSAAYGADTGMTLRDYFMAHAPADPQPWFQPVMPEAPKVPRAQHIEDRQIREDVMRADDAGIDPETNQGMEFVEQRSEAEALFRGWEAERRKQRYIQWPAAWADAMLAQRGGGK